MSSSWWRRNLGLDFIDLLIQVGVTGGLMGAVAVSGGPEEVIPLLLVLSFLVLGVRRHIALRSGARPGLTTGEMAAERIAELEQRVGELEAAQAQVVELAERLDFTERLLVQAGIERPELLRGKSSHG